MNSSIKTLHVETLVEDENFLPKYGSDHAAGADVMAHIPADIVIQPGKVL